ncbi:hypothetical protein ARMSODRAFT_1027550 [Armillaria solidipes]|uniref:Uncharacterized protein n=1 Tax=Armillaria solidipes TaxID=1076256 RepID=A0A2H3AR94_9AGAR|nr:hypothetical protein ARMSODRAFT_1027550 [Armillaria solidipes]
MNSATSADAAGTAAAGNAANVPDTTVKQAEHNNLRAARHTLRISAAPGTAVDLPPKVLSHNKEAMDLEKARLMNEVNTLENQVFLLAPKKTFPGLTGRPPTCNTCNEPVKGLPVTGMLGFERICCPRVKAFRIAPGESTCDADERNERTLKDRIVKRSIYYHWSCFKDIQKKHYADNLPIRHSSVDSQNWEKVLSDIEASGGEEKHDVQFISSYLSL